MEMRHSPEEITQAFNYLQAKDSSSEYQSKLIYIVEYVEDLINLVESYKHSAEESTKLVYEILQKIIQLNKETFSNKQTKIQRFKKMEMVRKIMNEIEKKKKEQE